MIHQENYIKELLKKFGMESAKVANTPMATTTKLDKDKGGKDVDEKL